MPPLASRRWGVVVEFGLKRPEILISEDLPGPFPGVQERGSGPLQDHRGHAANGWRAESVKWSRKLPVL